MRQTVLRKQFDMCLARGMKKVNKLINRSVFMPPALIFLRNEPTNIYPVVLRTFLKNTLYEKF